MTSFTADQLAAYNKELQEAFHYFDREKAGKIKVDVSSLGLTLILLKSKNVQRNSVFSWIGCRGSAILPRSGLACSGWGC
jgi:hypothetical protein